ncbi:MAG: hypothetical protein ACM3XO_18910 [Bacteroidota bacterium]|jgi:hypothetical protein
MMKEDDIREAIDNLSGDIIDLESNPRTWLSWMVYLLARLEEKSTISPSDKEAFFEMLSALEDEIRNRMRTGGWN